MQATQAIEAVKATRAIEPAQAVDVEDTIEIGAHRFTRVRDTGFVNVTIDGLPIVCLSAGWEPVSHRPRVADRDVFAALCQRYADQMR